MWMALLAPCPRVEFVATDAEADLLDGYREAALRYATRSGLDGVGADRGRLRLEGAGADARRIEVTFGTASVPKPPPAGPFDVLLAQSFWDLLPPGSAPAYARRVLVPDGLFLATLTFAGETRFEPSHPLDEPMLASYHRSMGGDRGGDPGAGDRMTRDFAATESGFRVLAEGSSDWDVSPGDEGYERDERFFVETILGFVAKETATDPLVPPGVRRDWLEARRRQLREGRLAYSARQRDLLAERLS